MRIQVKMFRLDEGNVTVKDVKPGPQAQTCKVSAEECAVTQTEKKGLDVQHRLWTCEGDICTGRTKYSLTELVDLANLALLGVSLVCNDRSPVSWRLLLCISEVVSVRDVVHSAANDRAGLGAILEKPGLLIPPLDSDRSRSPGSLFPLSSSG